MNQRDCTWATWENNTQTCRQYTDPWIAHSIPIATGTLSCSGRWHSAPSGSDTYATKANDGNYDPASCQKQLAEDPTCDTEWFGIAANNGRCWCVAVGDPCTAQNKALAIHYAFKHGPQDGRDAGYVDGRSLLFKKQSASSRLLVTYNDNMRVYGHGKACRWVVKLDGSDCSTGLIAMDMHVQGENNDHSPHVLMGYCDGVAAGDHEINVTVMQSPGYSGSDCYTG